MHYFSFLLLFSAIVYHLYIFFMLKINSKIEMTSLIQNDCSLVSKIDWNGYIFAMVVLMFVSIFKYYFIMY